MENQPRLPWFRLATMARQAEADSQSQPEPAQPAQAPPAPVPRQSTLPVARRPMVPPPVPQTRVPTPPLSSQPVIRRPAVLSPTVQPAQPNPRPVTPPPQQDSPKPAVPTRTTAPSPPPSPKVIKTSTPTPPPSPRVKTATQVPPISVSDNKAANPEVENKPAPVLSPLKSIAMLEDRDNKVNGNGGSYNNTNNNTNGTNGSADTSGKMNGATYSNGNSKISTGNNGNNGKNNYNDINHNNKNNAPHPEKKEIENGRGMFETRGKHQHSNSGTAMPNANHKKSDRDTKVITIAGENIGALMELGHNAHSYSRKMHQGGNSPKSGSGTQDEKAAESMDSKGGARAKPMTSLVNSNVQSINNSLLFNSSCTQKSPGVHLTFKSKSKGKAHKHGINSPSS
ncbi:vegetative cell wall protein gp1-like protein [Carex littledalei]|uniref:Vegetative cell wall protein gp1-like protein n=1 Tax=Carex littledalei TaxID=544730 RepID=A0A833R739_9POAL|nr:vegetative cell wall protein gp1-like protein [Carex littledalei]